LTGSLLKIAPQCCDAGSYIGYGSECAVNGKCYGELRPMGDYFWFAAPQKFGWPLESLVVANLVLMAISVLLSTIAFKKILLLKGRFAIGRAPVIFFLLFSLVIHAVYLQPTIFNTLSDPPANLFLLCSIWLLMLAHFNSSGGLAVEMQYLASGLCMGLAVWLRAFYLYPVIAGLAIYLILWIFSKNKQYENLLLLLALLPVGVQVITMHKAYGSYSYLQKETTSSWSSTHLNQPFVGYDTIFPRADYVWKPQHCDSKVGILNGLKAMDFKSLGCVISGRLYFYLGTYEPVTYIFTDRTNQLALRYIESIGAPKTDWRITGLQHEANVAIAPDGEMTADKLTAISSSPDGKGDVVMWVMLRGNTPHTFSVWLWSPVSKTINLAIKRHDDDAIVALQTFMLTPVPTRYSITGRTLDTALYDVDIGRTPYRNVNVSFGSQEGDILYAWGAQLETGSTMSGYSPTGVASPDSVRTWHPALLALNALMLVVAIAAISCTREFWLRQRAGIFILTIICASAAESIAIIPEQRFSIAWMIFFWLVATAYVSFFISHIFTGRPNK
jgi:hypothetical protein